MDPPVVLYRYKASPFGSKISYVLTLKNIPHKTVCVPMALPRPEITDVLGLNYRRIPILTIGNDVWCDTSAIMSALEKRFPPAAGYGTIFPHRKGSDATDPGLQKAFAMFYADRPLFRLTSSTMPFDRFSKEFLKDRSAFNNRPIDPTKELEAQPTKHSLLSSHVALAEEQLADGREYYLDTVSPGLADISIYFNFSWITRNKGVSGILDAQKFPKFMAWFSRVKAYLAKKGSEGWGPSEKIDSQKAAQLILGSPYEPALDIVWDATEADRLKVKVGDTVAVTPDDTGSTHPTAGKLIGLDREEVVLEVRNARGVLRVHFPRLNFTITSKASSKL
ncbi:hypothetical protein SISSUDRAFT_1021659 [Sistotremastrum suecicum HHB10207 ss-3]|uniref:GST N-terminal domain-containing protein n=1 Tax=Sistotremastrum suecicum HHB10207 ss-3 TaxID=1314776 RepID=A0A166DCG9_9AGAM|nr:hypothetical protein SISSUDRAFT_1021659 [Sistotremastrum suecicum HHB10207 ss-3]